MKDWKTVRLGDVATYINGYAFKPSDWGTEGLPIIRIQNLTGNDYETNYYNGKIPEKYYVKNGDVLISWSASLGVYEWKKSDALLNQHIFKVVFDKIEVDKQYFMFTVSNLLNAMVKQTHGSTMRHITKPDFDNMPFPLPPLSEQKQIANTLSKCNSLIIKHKTMLEKYDSLIKSRFIEMFGDLENNQKKFQTATIEDVCLLIKDGTHQTPEYTEDSVNGFKFLSSKDVMTQKIDWTNIKYIPKELHQKLYASIQPRKNDILMSKNGVNYGVAAVNDTDEVFDIYVSLALLRPKEIINPVYFRCVINNPDTKKQFSSSIKGIGVPNLHLGEIKKTKILLPPIELQNDFAAFVQQIDKSKFTVQKSLEKAETLYKSLMQEYFG